MKSFFRVVWTSSSIVPLVTLLTIISATAASVQISWSPNAPPPEGYRVFARRSDQAFDYTLPFWEGCDTTCTIDGLEDQTDYYFVIQAFNGDLKGEHSAEIHYLSPETNHRKSGLEEGEDSHPGQNPASNQTDEDDFIDSTRTGNGPLREQPLPPIPLSAEFSLGEVYNLVLNIENHAAHTGNPPAATHWQIYNAHSGNCIFDLITDRRLSRLKVSSVPFDDGMTYHWRARFFDSRGRVSDWSEVCFFTSDATPDDYGECDRPT